MYFKLAFRNMKRSIKDYAVYFFTLIIAVCLFYTFNSIESQSVVLDLSSEQKSVFESINTVLGIFSVFISFILGFLIIYANNYLIKRRKKELGIYLVLGMDKSKVSKMLFVETLLIGIISLFVGICFGMVTSQCMSIVTGKLFEADMSSFKFIFSYSAFIKTIVSFSIIYIVVLLFNSKVLKKVKVINLLNASKKNQDIKVKNLTLSVILFIISVGFIGTGYYLVLKRGIAVIDYMFIPVILGVIGTFLLFMSLSGFLLKVLKACPKIYLKEVNMFLLRQINSKINTTFVSMSFICLMLFISICSLSGGIATANGINKNLRDLKPHNVTMYSYQGKDITKILNDAGYDFDKYFKDYGQYTEYMTDTFRYSTIFSEEDREKHKNYYPVNQDEVVPVIKLSDYNKQLKMMGKDEAELSEDEYICYSDIDDISDVLKRAVDNGTEINLNGKKFVPKKDKVNNITFINQIMKCNCLTVVVNDNAVEDLAIRNVYLNADTNDSENYDELNKVLEGILEKQDVYSITDKKVIASAQGTGAMVAYMGIYIGIVFIISSAAVLAIQQLSETSDNIERYNLLRKIGVEEKTINRSLFKQIGIYFFMPLIIAVIHSIAGLQLAREMVNAFTNSGNILELILISGMFIVVVYGGYFICTYLSAKRQIKSENSL